MFLKITKVIVYTVVVLLVGQISVGKSTVGGTVYAELTRLKRWGIDEIKRTPAFQKLGSLDPFTHWVGMPTRQKPVPVAPPEPELDNDSPTLEGEDLTPSDRDSLLRLLE